MEMAGLAGLYCYYLGLCHAWMAAGGLAGWLIPSEFMDTNYGRAVKHYLLDKVTLLHIHRFDPSNTQFGDALVSSAVVWICNALPPADHAVRFSYGGSLNQPEQDRWASSKTLRQDPKWTRYPYQAHFTPVNTPVLGDFFRIKRGLVTGHNRYFILPEEEIVQRGLPKVAFRPILPSPRYLVDDHIVADTDGHPVLDRNLFLLDCRWDEQAVAQKYPTLWAYLEEGKAQGVADRYLCRHRTPW